MSDQESNKRDTQAVQPTRRATVLIAEDNEDISFMICETLRSYTRWNLITAKDGKECLEKAKKMDPDVILLDVHMPEMDGFTVCSVLKEDDQTRDIPIIFLTATADDLRNKIRGLEMGAFDYLVQPVDNLELVTRIRIMLKIKRLIAKARGMGSSKLPLSAETAHKLRSPLNTIIGLSELLQKPFYGELSDKQKEFARLISESGRQLLSLINELAEE